MDAAADGEIELPSVAEHDFDDTKSAAHALLLEAASIAAAADEQFVVVGGWSPYLNNSATLGHPGTKDVDLLFEAGATKDSLGAVVDGFLQAGYLVSAKHNFQLVRLIPVRGTVLAFGVDFLHPHEGEVPDTGLDDDMFVDHGDLEIPAWTPDGPTMQRKSIGTAHLGVIFHESLFDSCTVRATTTSGGEQTVDVPLVNEAGLIISKAQSVWNRKRQRDAFDMYLAAIHARRPDEVIDGLARAANDEAVRDLLHALEDRLGDLDKDFNERVAATCARSDLTPPVDAAAAVRSVVASAREHRFRLMS